MIAAQPAERPASRLPSVGWVHALTALRFLIAVAGAGAVSGAIQRALPRPLGVRTDIVGYPIYNDYNIELPLATYYLVVVLFPLTALLLYVVLGRLCRALGLTSAPAERAATGTGPGEDTGRDARASGTAAARALAVGAVFGLEAAIVVDPPGWWYPLAIAAPAVVYVGLLVGVVHAVHRVIGALPRRQLMAIIDALAAPLAVVGLLAVSEVTTVTVGADGTVHHYRWLPAWLALLATGALVAWIGAAIVRAGGQAAVEIERRAVLLVTGPVCLFLLIGVVPYALRPMDMFHDGESLAAARLTLEGYFPWRDLMTIHGILQDQLSALPGIAVFGDSRWGAEAGRYLLIAPVAAICLYLFAGAMFGRAWPIVCAAGAVLVGGLLSVSHLPNVPPTIPLALVWDTRFMFWPLLLVLMRVALDRTRRWPSALLGVALALQTVLAPESAYSLIAVGLVLALRDWYSRAPGQTLALAFSRTTWFAAGAAALGAAAVGLLVVNGALADLVMYFLAFARGHELTGGLPIAVRTWLADPATAFLVLSTPVAGLLVMSYLAAAISSRRWLESLDWVMAAAALFALLYYPKFLARADGHVVETYGVTVPVIALLLYRGCQFAERWAARVLPRARVMRLTARPVAVLVLALALVGTGANLTAAAWQAPAHFRAQVSDEPLLNREGYATDAVDPATYQDVNAVLRAYLRPGDWIFDFSNAPAFYYYLLGRDPHTRYFHVSMAIAESAQKDLVAELRRDRPKLVVFTSSRFGSAGWDGIPNPVRHYDVSQYILDNYRPLLSVRGQVLYADAAAGLSPDRIGDLPLGEAPVTRDLPFAGPSCDWGAAPNFLAVDPPARVRSSPTVTVQPRPSSGGALSVVGWAVDPRGGEPVREVVAVAGGRVLARGSTGVDRPDVAAARRQPAAARSGFELEIPRSSLPADTDRPAVAIYGISAAGAASELSGGAAIAPAGAPVTALDLGGATIPVRPGAARGVVDEVRGAHLLEMALPAGLTWSGYRWLEIDAPETGLRADTWTITDSLPAVPGRTISFRTLDGARSIRVYVGSCPQWHGYTAASLAIAHDHPQQVTSIRLVSS